MTLLANRWAQNGHTVSISTLFTPVRDHYALGGGIERQVIGLTGPAGSRLDAARLNVRRIQRVRRMLKALRPDVAVSFIDRMNVVVIAASLGLRLPVVVSERTDPRMETLDPLVRFLRARLYGRAAGVVAQTRNAAEWAADLVSRDRISIIPNPVMLDGPRFEEPGPNGTVVGIGRLGPEKGFDRLVEAFGRFAATHPSWLLRIHGEGPERASLERQVAATPVADRISLPGIAPSPAEALRGAGMFVLSSRHEGFPNVVLEAMALGVPTVAFACPSGPDEIITDGVDGLLVPPGNVAALAQAMSRVADDAELMNRLAKEGPGRAADFALDTIGHQWDELLARVTSAPVPPDRHR